MMNAPPKSIHGHEHDEIKSALQKAIRRGNEEDALYWAAELSPEHDEILWQRLLIITSEDVGLAYPSGPAIIWSLYQMWMRVAKGKIDPENARLFIIHAVLLLVRSKKSRIVDHATAAAFNEILPDIPPEMLPKREMPTYALDMHTEAGQNGNRGRRGIEHFFKIGGLLNNCEMPDPYEKRVVAAYMKAGRAPGRKGTQPSLLDED